MRGGRNAGRSRETGRGSGGNWKVSSSVQARSARRAARRRRRLGTEHARATSGRRPLLPPHALKPLTPSSAARPTAQPRPAVCLHLESRVLVLRVQPHLRSRAVVSLACPRASTCTSRRRLTIVLLLPPAPAARMLSPPSFFGARAAARRLQQPNACQHSALSGPAHNDDAPDLLPRSLGRICCAGCLSHVYIRGRMSAW